MITTPTKNTAWVNGQANAVTWSKGLLDGVNVVDVELARLTQDGLTFVAMNYPTTSSSSLNIYLQDIPAGDDYFLLFLNSTHGVMYATSPRFTILAASATVPSNLSTAAAIANVPTATVSGAPNPTMAFATTFPAVANAATSAFGSWREGWTRSLLGVGVAFGFGLGSAVWTVW